MAIYRCEIKTVSRSQGASAVAGAAYRAGLDVTDLRTGERHDYTRKQGVVASGILAPAGSPEWVQDPAQLWNAAEAAETRKNSVVAREFLVSLPHELTEEQRAELARDITANLVDRFCFAAMFAIHAPDKKADERNHHVHILATTRRMEPTGLGAKTRELDDRKTGAVEEVRAQVADTINAHLERAGLVARVDHRSLLDRQMAAVTVGDFAQAAELDRQPEPKVGRTATAAARRGKRSPRAERVQRVRAENAQHAQAQADRFRELKSQAAAEGRLGMVDEQALHARALLERQQSAAPSRSSPSTPQASRHDSAHPQRRRAPALTRHSLDAVRVRKPGPGDERVPALRPLHSLNPGLAAGGRRAPEAGGFSRVLRPDAPRYHDPRPAVLRISAQELTPRSGAAIQARAQRPAAHKAGSSMPRPAPVGGGQQGKGAAAIERASRKHSQNRQAEIMAGDQAAKNLEEMIEQMFKMARRALQSSSATPEQRSVSRTLLKCHTDLLECRAAHVQACEERQQARLARRRAVADANTFPVPTDFLSTALRKVGRPTAEDKAARAAQEQNQQAKLQEQQARKVRDQTKEAKNKAGVAFELATADFLVQFPKHFPPVKSTAELAPTRDMAPVPQTPEQALRTPEPVNPPRRPSPRP
ncbi:TPA: MobA/MobL family protein [Stenotrophomonas maltophilia]|nr:MobA/MobL family protein [Stenotrophomonas maltophilia]HEL3637750.1 MobA/MobL family protein [Stenotrophomonas maltophilia]HEL3798264.1 MobA/MobL family protein [Stenotrophomonas maltophilia]HEL3830092.1 MobA/MobL family protein [Stenotrophomonas maltophilia]HEL4132105.1 MobA/MobL family protein [Stenotrophomonas maltophilia]